MIKAIKNKQQNRRLDIDKNSCVGRGIPAYLCLVFYDFLFTMLPQALLERL